MVLYCKFELGYRRGSLRWGQGIGKALAQRGSEYSSFHGGLECDRIIMADGTAIDLFDENDDSSVSEKAHRRSRERHDEVRNSDQ